MRPARTIAVSAVLLFLLFVAPVRVAGQATEARANSFFLEKNWEEAAKAYATLVQETPENGPAWYRLGVARHRLARYEEAAEAWMRADELQFFPQASRYNTASALARLSRIDEAFAWLGKAVDAGFNQVQTLRTDEDLSGLRDDARFAQLVDRVDRAVRPCAYDDSRRQFDFWVGQWDVTNPAGRQAGTNTVEKAQRDCILVEHWTGAGGGTGTSNNYFDASTNQWKQTWVDSGGNNARFEGAFSGGAMRMTGEWVNFDGSSSLMKMTYTPLEDGRVRQYIEQSLDEGETWNVWFDGYYASTSTEGSRAP